MTLTSESTDNVKIRIDKWKRSLLDLSRRNRLINFRPSKSSTVRIVDESPYEIFRILVLENKVVSFDPRPEEVVLPIDPGSESEIVIAPIKDEFPEVTEITADLESDDEITDVDEEVPEHHLDTKLQTDLEIDRLNHNLLRTHNLARTSMEEQGYNTLFLAIGFLDWIEDERFGRQKSPLLLVPVRLYRQSVRHSFNLRILDEDPILNPAIVRKLDETFKIKIDDLPDDPLELDLQGFFESIETKISEHTDWNIKKDIYLGLFKYAKFIMYKDLESHEVTLTENPTVQKISGVFSEENVESVTEIESDEIETLLHPSSTNQIMDADSSQQEAILLVKNGANLVLQGPPGTGKSQTIANIIAECLGCGKRVLFVSEKMAALEVVKRRLTKVGLGPFCLELHSNKANKRAVMTELAHSLEIKFPDLSIDSKKLDRLYELRIELETYLKELHDPHGALGLSAYDVYGILDSLEDSTNVLADIPGIAEVSYESLEEITRLGKDLSRHLETIGDQTQHPWYGASVTDDSFSKTNSIKESLSKALESLSNFKTSVEGLSSETGFKVADTINETNTQVGNVKKIAADPMSGPLGSNSEIASSMQRQNALMSELDKILTRDFFSQDLTGLNERWKKYSGNFLKFINPGYWSDKSAIKAMLKPDAEAVDYSDMLEKAITVQSLQATIVNYFNERTATVETARDNFLESWSALSSEIGFESTVGFGSPFFDTEFTKIKSKMDLISGNIDDLGRWAKFQTSLQSCMNTPMGPFVIKWLSENLEPENLTDSFKFLFYRKWLDLVFKGKESLKTFEGKRREDNIREFQELDVYQMKAAQKRISRYIADNRPDMTWEASKTSELGILQRECKRKRGHKPIRILFNKLIPNIITDIKPCFMMSPISVAQYIDPDVHQFDVVVFDEASQITPEDAIGSIIRGSQVVVVGDSKQLPPTSFFQDTGLDIEEEDDEYSLPELESILDECATTGFPQRSLQWHYRSRHESLIAFSNRYFYDNTLNTFPSADNSPEALGVSMVYNRDCIYDTGKSRTNKCQAEEVAKAVIEQLRAHPDKTLGVGTFSQAQQEAVIDALEIARRENLDVEQYFNADSEEPFFVKNLENIQGDERDVIFISVGYGPDSEGNISMNFGPLNKTGGHRRLNVLVTRARWRLVIFSSLRGDDIDLSRTESVGAHRLKNYLDYAEKGPGSVFTDTSISSGRTKEGTFEDAIGKELKDYGLEFDSKVGFSGYKVDFAVKDPEIPEKYLLGIECDGEKYAYSRTTRDRDRTRPFVLGRLGWNIKRIWSTDWFRDKDEQVEEILAALKAAKTPPEEKESEEGSSETIESTPSDAPITNANHGTDSELVVNYKFAHAGKKGQPEDFVDEPVNRIAMVLLEVVNAESPIHINEAAKRVALSWRRRKTTKVVIRKVTEAARFLERGNRVVIRGTFLWDPSMKEIVIRSRGDDDTPRKAELIPPEEYISVIRLILEKEYRLSMDNLATQVKRVFGFKRGGSDIEREAKNIISVMIQQGALKSDGELVSL